MKTKNVVEMLLFSSSNKNHLKKVLKICRVLNEEDRDWQPKEHEELKNYLDPFKEFVCICTISTIIDCIFISPKPKNRLYNILIIEGNTSEIKNISKKELSKMCVENFKKNDFMPTSYCNQIYYIPYKEDNYKAIDDEYLLSNINKAQDEDETIDMIVFSEYQNTKRSSLWTIDSNISSPEVYTSMQTSAPTIIKNILKEI